MVFFNLRFAKYKQVCLVKACLAEVLLRSIVDVPAKRLKRWVSRCPTRWLGSIDAHGLKIQGSGQLRFFLPKSLGGSRLSGENCQDWSPFIVSMHFHKKAFFENLPGGPNFIPPSPTPNVHLPMLSRWV